MGPTGRKGDFSLGDGMAEPRLISVVVPVYNEAESLAPLADEIRQVARENQLRVEVVFVDDGSTDASWSRIGELVRGDASLAGIRFRRNSGKAAALMAGFALARGEVVITMDADGQDPPQEMPHLLARLEQGFDVVSGWKRVRHDPWHKVYPSHVFNRLIGRLTGVRLHDHVCGLKCFRREVVKELHIHGELHRFMAVLAAARGYRVTEIPTIHRARTRGVGKYGFTRFFKGFLDLITVLVLTRYRWRPQHVIGVAGLVLILVNLVLALSPRLGAWVGPLVTILVPGMILIAIGLVGELIVANRPADQLYTIMERVGWCAVGEGSPDEVTDNERRNT